MKKHLANERGITLIAMALWMTAFFALTAVGVDVGRIAFTASEVQSAADTAALAAARAFLDGGDPQATGKMILGNGTAAVPNTIDSRSAYAAASTITIETGTADNSGNFTAGGGAAANAARATVIATVTNLFSGVFAGNDGTTIVTKQATAVLTTTGEDQPTVPIAVSGGCFTDKNCTAGNCPALNASTNDAGWTGFDGGASTSTIRAFFPQACDSAKGYASTNPAPILTTDESINLLNGVSATPLFGDFHCLVCTLNQTKFIVPVVDKPCGAQFNQSDAIIGFAEVTIDKAAYCAGPNTNIVLQSVRGTGAPGTVSKCPHCGFGFIRLIG